LDENPLTGSNPDYLKEYILELLGIDLKNKKIKRLDIESLDSTI
jgi:hypothetical protein